MMPITAPVSRLTRSNLLAFDRPFWTCLAGLYLLGCVLGWLQHIHTTMTLEYVQIGLLLFLAGRVSAVLCRSDRSLSLIFESLAAFILAVEIMGPLSYAATRSPFPAVDSTINHLEAAMGFHPAELRHAVFSHPVLSTVLAQAYLSHKTQYLIALFVLPRTRMPTRGLELMRASVLALVVSYVIAFFLPTIGTLPADEPWSRPWHLLHDNRMPVDFGTAIHAIISLPSYHAVMAVLLVYYTRGLGLFSVLTLLVDTLMLVATPVMGCHHLTDLIIGVLVALLSIHMLNRPYLLGTDPVTIPTLKNMLSA